MCKPSLESNSLSSRCRENISLIQFIWVVQSNTQFVENRGSAWQMIPTLLLASLLQRKAWDAHGAHGWGCPQEDTYLGGSLLLPRAARCRPAPGAHAALLPTGTRGRPSPGPRTPGPRRDAPASAPKASQLKRTNPCWHVSLKPAGTRGWRLLSGFPKPGAQLITCQLYLQTSQV